MDVFEYADRRAPDADPPPSPAEDMPGWWRGLAVLLLAGILFFATAVVLGVFERLGLIPGALLPLTLPPLAPAYYPDGWFEPFTHVALRRAMTATAWLFALTLPMVLGFWLAWRWLVGRPLRLLLGPWPEVWRDFVLMSALGLPILGAEMAWVFSQSKIGPQNWAGLFPVQTLVIFALLPVQTLAEEVIFRGFLQRWLIRRTGRAWLGVALQSAAFASLHPGIHSVIFVLGVATGIAAHRSGALGASWAIHLLNNVFALMLFFRPVAGRQLLAGYEQPLIVGPQLVFLLLLPLFLSLRRRRSTSAPPPPRPRSPAAD